MANERLAQIVLRPVAARVQRRRPLEHAAAERDHRRHARGRQRRRRAQRGLREGEQRADRLRPCPQAPGVPPQGGAEPGVQQAGQPRGRDGEQGRGGLEGLRLAARGRTRRGGPRGERPEQARRAEHALGPDRGQGAQAGHREALERRRGGPERAGGDEGEAAGEERERLRGGPQAQEVCVQDRPERRAGAAALEEAEQALAGEAAPLGEAPRADAGVQRGVGVGVG